MTPSDTTDTSHATVATTHATDTAAMTPAMTPHPDTVAVADTVAARPDSLPAAAPLFELKLPEPAPKPPDWRTGLRPAQRVQVAADDPGVISLFVSLFLILAVTFRHSRKLFGSLWRDLWSVRRRRLNFTDRTPAESRMVAVFYIQLIIFLALTTQCHLRLLSPDDADPGWSFARTVAYGGMWLIYYTFMLSAYRTVGYTFSDQRSTQLWLRGFNASQVYAGFLLAIPAAVAVFVPDLATGAVTVATAIYLSMRLIFIVKGFRIFYTGFASLFYFFLYLCSLEIAPLFIVYRSALYIAHSTILSP